MSAAQRVMHRCDELAAISALPEGILRAYLTEEHRRHNDLAAGWMEEAGQRATTAYQVWQDAAGNQCLRIEGREPGLPALMIASHLDTVPDAGRYDGILGVLVGIEIAYSLAPYAAELPFALELAAFGDEEGTRFGATLLGSRALAGTWDEDWFGLTDSAGITIAQALTDFGLDPARVGEAARKPEELIGYLEAHIEQGPYLEAAQRPLGIVTSIAGARRFQISIHGEARHAGGTPYTRRQDALVGASQAVVQIERIGKAQNAIATVGQMNAYPGAVNVVPGRAEFSLDVRAETDELLHSTCSSIEAAIQETCVERSLRYEIEELHAAPTVFAAEPLMEAVTEGIRATGDLEPMSLFSRAGHDAMAVAAIAPVGMLFTRCYDGISHHPDESITVEDAAYTIDAMEHAVWHVAAQTDRLS